MNKKQKLVLSLSLLSLTVLMIGFQNCSQTGVSGLTEGDLIDGMFSNPNVIVSTSPCGAPTSTFHTGQVIYICVQDGGSNPNYCFEQSNGPQPCAPFQSMQSMQGWTYNNGSWYKGFSGTNAIPQGSYSVYAQSETSPQIGTSFTVLP